MCISAFLFRNRCSTFCQNSGEDVSRTGHKWKILIPAILKYPNIWTCITDINVWNDLLKTSEVAALTIRLNIISHVTTS